MVGHGIPQDTIERSFGVAQQFFSLGQEEKEAASPFAQQLNSGYEFMTQVRPSTGTADQKESLQITARRGCMDHRWPGSPPEFEEVAKTMMESCNVLVARILSLLEPKACPHLAPGTLARAHTLWGEDGQCTLRYLHYPPMTTDTLEQSVHRAGAKYGNKGAEVAQAAVEQVNLYRALKPRRVGAAAKKNARPRKRT